MKTISHGPAIAQAIVDREPFKTRGSLSGDAVTGLTAWNSGRLSGLDLMRFQEVSPRIRYVVYSYATPIAWFVQTGLGTGYWYKVRQKFSPTTGKHQGMLYLISEGEQ